MVEIGAADGEAEDEGRKPQDDGWLLIVGNSLRDKSEILLKRARWEGSTGIESTLECLCERVETVISGGDRVTIGTYQNILHTTVR